MTLPLLALALVAPADAVAAKTHTARVLECKSSDAPDARTATFLGRMRAIPGKDGMRMRFTLLERFGDEKLHPVSAPELRTWRSAKPGVRDFRYKQTVTALQGGGEYRMRVDFRWVDSEGRLLRKAQSMTPSCAQKGVLANLRVGLPTALAGPGGTGVYVVPVENEGTAPANDVAIELFVDGAATNVGRIDSIAPRETRELRFTGPVCKRRLRVVADPLDTVKETLESDNVLHIGCPPLGR